MTFCKTIIRKYSPIITQGLSRGPYHGYFIVDGFLHNRRHIGNNITESISYLNRLLIEAEDVSDYAMGNCNGCGGIKSFIKANNALACFKCGWHIRGVDVL